MAWGEDGVDLGINRDGETDLIGHWGGAQIDDVDQYRSLVCEGEIGRWTDGMWGEEGCFGENVRGSCFLINNKYFYTSVLTTIKKLYAIVNVCSWYSCINYKLQSFFLVD